MNFYRPPALHEALEAIGYIYRALRAWQFYPTGHPARKSSIIKAHASMLHILDDHDLTLLCGRNGFSLPDGEVLKDAANPCDSLSYELFIRRAKTITFLHDLRQEDLLDLVRVLTIPHEDTRTSGGIDSLLDQHGVSTIWVNEFDLSIIHGRRQQREAKGVLPPGLEEVESGVLEETGGSAPATVNSVNISPHEYDLETLVAQLIDTQDEDRHLILMRQAVICAELLISGGQPDKVIPFLELLAEQAGDTTTGHSIRQNATSVLEQLAAIHLLLQSVLDQMEHRDRISGAAVTALMRGAGHRAVALILESVGKVTSLSLRKNLNAVLVEIGDVALPALLAQTGDARWYIVRNICSVLGDIGNSAAVPDLVKCLSHSDARVCKEAIRSLAKIGGSTAESALIKMLKQADPQLLPQVMASLGGMKSKKALGDFLSIVLSKDIFLANLALKCDALSAIAMIDEPAAVPKLVPLLDARFLMASKRGIQLKIAVVDCLAKLCDPGVIPILSRYTANDGEFGKACAAAIEILGSRMCQTKDVSGRNSNGRS